MAQAGYGLENGLQELSQPKTQAGLEFWKLSKVCVSEFVCMCARLRVCASERVSEGGYLIKASNSASCHVNKGNLRQGFHHTEKLRKLIV